MDGTEARRYMINDVDAKSSFIVRNLGLIDNEVYFIWVKGAKAQIVSNEIGFYKSVRNFLATFFRGVVTGSWG